MSISSSELRDTAKGVVKFRDVIDFISDLALFSFSEDELTELLLSNITWTEVFERIGISQVKSPDGIHNTERGIVLVKK